MNRIIVFLLITLLPASLSAQELNIIPRPVKAEKKPGYFILSPATRIVLNDSQERIAADFLNDYLKRFYGFTLKFSKEASSGFIRLSTKRFIRPGTEGKYDMAITSADVSISGDTYQGTFYGVQTLIQLLPVPKDNLKIPGDKLQIPCALIEDVPRFAYRGMHLDVGRHFFPVDFIKKYIDYLAYFKFNTFHWHLTEDQGWRFEIKKYPKLTQVGAWRNGTIIGRYPGKGNDNILYGGFYTQEQIKEVVKYAADRYITIIPEIEMPGHSSAAIAAYPWLSCFPEKPTQIPANMISKKSVEEQKNGRIKLVQETWGVFEDVFCAGKDSTFKFLEDVIDEVVQLFPSPYIHVGGDECPKSNWKICPNCQRRIKEEELKDEHELQSYFIQRMEKYINSKGKTLIGWDEILEGGLAPNAIVMSWRGEAGGIAAAKENHKVIMTPGSHVYFDHSQTKKEDSVTIGGFTPLEKAYSYEPVPKELDDEQAKYVMGAQGNVWTEYMAYPSKVEYMIFPRMCALSEVLWSPKEKRDWKDFQKRIPLLFKRFDLWKTNYSKAYYDIKTSILPTSDQGGILWKLESPLMAGRITYSFGTSSPGKAYTSPVLIRNSDTYHARLYLNGRIITSIAQRFFINKATGKNITLTQSPSAEYPNENGVFALVNGIISENASNPDWLAFAGEDMEAIIDLGNPTQISKVSCHVAETNGSRSYLPQLVEVFTSIKGDNYIFSGKTSSYKEDKPNMGYMRISLTPVTTRYVKVIAKNIGKIPEGRPGAGEAARMFVDEIQVE